MKEEEGILIFDYILGRSSMTFLVTNRVNYSAGVQALGYWGAKEFSTGSKSEEKTILMTMNGADDPTRQREAPPICGSGREERKGDEEGY